MTYVHFELLLICVNKYSMRKIRYRERESRDLLRGQKERPSTYGVVGLYL